MNLRYIFIMAMVVAVGTLVLKADGQKGPSIILNEIESSDKVHIIAPNDLSNRLLREYNDVENNDSIVEKDDKKDRIGYRVQVYDNNNVRTAKAGAEACKTMIEEEFPEFTAYLQFHSPYWRVKVGDFTTRSEAEVFMEAIREEFPEMSSQLRVVRDRIKVQK